jgi:glutaredoxin
LKFVEINIDVYTEREKELNQRIGNSNSNSTVPMIFFNEKLIGGLVELNAMRTNGELEKKLIEIANGGFSGDVPVAPAYGFDEVAEEKVAVEEEIAKAVRVFRQRLPIQDRLMKMKIVRNCFDGSELVELLVRNHGYVHDKVRLFS